MSQQKTIRLSSNSTSVIKQVCTGSNINYNGAVNGIIYRYQLICQKCLPELNEHEKLAIAQAYNGRWADFKDVDREIEIMPWQIDQAIQYDGNVADLLCGAFELDRAELIQSDELKEFMQKVNDWNYAERMAVYYFAVGFWSARSKEKSIDTYEQLKKRGAELVEFETDSDGNVFELWKLDDTYFSVVDDENTVFVHENAYREAVANIE